MDDKNEKETYRKFNFIEEKYYKFESEVFSGYGKSTDFDYTQFVEKATSEKGFKMVIAKGNMFMKGVYISTKEMKMAHKGFNNTLHDLNHMGSGYRAGFFSVVPPDIAYIVGWQDGLSYDNATDEVRAYVHVKETAPKYEDWKNYIDISAEIDRMPNVSMVVYAKIEYIEARKLPKGCGYGRAGYKADDIVPCMVDIRPFMVATVTQGACNDKDGCGIGNSCKTNDTDTNEATDETKIESKTVKEIDSLEKEKNKQIAFYKNRLKEIGE